MTPAAEKDHIIVVARVWRAPDGFGQREPLTDAVRAGGAVPVADAVRAGGAVPVAGAVPAGGAVPVAGAVPAGGAVPVADAALAGGAVTFTEAVSVAARRTAAARPAWPHRPAVSSPRRAASPAAHVVAAKWAADSLPAAAAARTVAVSTPDATVPGMTTDGTVRAIAADATLPAATQSTPAATTTPVSAATVPSAAARVRAAAASAPPGAPLARGPEEAAAASAGTGGSAAGPAADSPVSPRRSTPAAPPGMTVHGGSAADRPLHVVERALRTSPGGVGWGDRVVVVPGGHRPGKPDHVQRDQARARLALPGPLRIVVLGSTAGAGQTVTALLTGQLLASLRGEAVAVLDLCAGPGSVTELAREIPRLLPVRQPAARADRTGGAAKDRALQVVTDERTGSGPRDADRLIDAVCARYPLTIADPPAGDVPRALQAADQLVLVSPASADAAGSLAMTLEWLEAHGHSRLVQASVTVLNGVSAQTAAHAERAAGIAIGRCRAVVRVPWDARLSDGGALGAETVRAFTALAGVLVSGMAASGPGDARVEDTTSTGPEPAGQISR
jgi:hypothetical protein